MEPERVRRSAGVRAVALAGTPGPRRSARPAAAAGSQAGHVEWPIARVAVDTGVAHLDRPFDYAVPPELAEGALPGCRVRVRFAGRLVDGIILERAADSDHVGELSPLKTLVSAQPVLTAEVAELCRAVADRMAGSFWDVVRLAVPPRHARVEAEPPRLGPFPLPPTPPDGSWERYPTGPGYLRALAQGRSPRAVWSALPGGTWPSEIMTAVRACLAAGRGAIVVAPDARDAARLAAAAGDLDVALLRADLGPALRYRTFLRVLRGEVRCVVGTRAAAYAPVRDLGLVVVWDDGDDLHAEPRAPYPHVREVLLQRARLAGAAVLLGGHARTAEAQLLLSTGWARELRAPTEVVRAVAPRVVGTGDQDLARDPLAAAARLPQSAFEAARHALAAGAPVLVQVPRRGYVPALSCVRDRTAARCARCSGPLTVRRRAASASCGWCGAPAADWRCPVCEGTALRAVVLGERRTAEELGRAFPGVLVRTSGRDDVLATVPRGAALVVSTPGAEPVADGGYGAVLLLDSWASLGRQDLRAGEETLRRWFNAAALARGAAEDGRVVVVADPALPAVQALVQWNPASAAGRELADRVALGFPPATRMASVTGPAAALRDVADEVRRRSLEVLGPVAHGDDERLLVRVPIDRGDELARALRAVQAVRTASKAQPVRLVLDPQELG